MGALVLELNDIDLCISDGASLRLHSPGYARLGDTLEVGASARAQARLHPRQINSQFWMRLGTEPLSHPHPRARHHADLAFAHLCHIHEQAGGPAEILFAVPGNLSREQLAVLLGIAHRCPFRAVGLVDSAVAAASGCAIAGDTAAHVELQLHQSVITRLQRQDDGIMRTGVEIIPATGISQLLDRWARLVASAFIQQSRFDPMHAAASEQQLYDRLPDWLARLGREGDVSAELGSGGSTYRAQLRFAEMVDAARDIYRQIIDVIGSTSASVLLSHRSAQLPGFAALLPTSTLLATDVASAACHTHQPLIRSDEQALRFVTRLPCPAPNTASAPSMQQHRPFTATRLAAPPSHLASGTHAYRLAHGSYFLHHESGPGWQLLRQQPQQFACSLRGDDAGWWLEPQPNFRVLRNEERISGATRLFAGDRIRVPELSDTALWLLAEVDAHGA